MGQGERETWDLMTGSKEVGQAEVIQAPPPPEVKPDPRTGELPKGWQFADDGE